MTSQARVAELLEENTRLKSDVRCLCTLNLANKLSILTLADGSWRQQHGKQPQKTAIYRIAKSFYFRQTDYLILHATFFFDHIDLSA
jgi:hypothetical protein